MASEKQQQYRLDAMKPRVKPVGLFSSLKLELSVLIVIATAIAFAMCWFLLKYGWSGWIAMPLTMVVALGITYFFSAADRAAEAAARCGRGDVGWRLQGPRGYRSGSS